MADLRQTTELPSHRLLARLIVMLLILGEVAAIALGSVHEPIYRAYHLVQMLLLIAMAFAIRSEISDSSLATASKPAWTSVAGRFATAAVFSLAGDLINSELLDLTFLLRPQVLLSIPFFAVAHLLYIGNFHRMTSPPIHPVSAASLRKRMIITVAIGIPITLVVWNLIARPGDSAIATVLSLLYGGLLLAMAITSEWVSRAWGRAGLSVTVGALLFLFSDALIGFYLVAERPFAVSQLIWATYLLGQLLIVRAGLLYRVVMPKQSPALGIVG